MLKYLLLIIVIAAGIYLFILPSNSTLKNEVVIYIAHDQDYSEPIITAFEEETGISVKAVYDTEASKTVGLTNRLIAEKDNPQADVFWNNEVTRTIQLKNEGILEAYKPENFDLIADTNKDTDGYWTGFAARARVLLVSSDLVDEETSPTDLSQLTNEAFADKITIADPRFGTTGSHIAALFSVWGEDETKQYFMSLKENGLDIAQSNGTTRDKVVNGEMMVGFTDTDDANDAVSEGAPIRLVYPDQGEDKIGTLIIPNSVALIKDSPHTDNAKKLINFLISAETESKLAYAKSVQMPLLPDVDTPDNVPSVDAIKAMDVSWEDIYNNLQPALTFVEDELLVE